MSLYTEQIAGNWINDQLDLYNLAVRLGDADWQAQILLRLQDKDSLIRQEIDATVHQNLWSRFEEINSRMVAIYRQIRENGNKNEIRQLREKAWELKRERVLIGKRLRENETN